MEQGCWRKVNKYFALQFNLLAPTLAGIMLRHPVLPTLIVLALPALSVIAEEYTYEWNRAITGASNFTTVGNWNISGGPADVGPNAAGSIIDPSPEIPLGSLSPLGLGAPGAHAVNHFTYTRPDTWVSYAATSTTFFPTQFNILGTLGKDGEGQLIFRGNPSTSYVHNIKSLAMQIDTVDLRGGLLAFGADDYRVFDNGNQSSHGSLYGFSAQQVSIFSGTSGMPTNSRLEFHVRDLLGYSLTTQSASSYADTAPGRAEVGTLQFHGANTSHVQLFQGTTLGVGALLADGGTLTLDGAVDFSAATWMSFLLGADGSAPTVQRQGGDWTFQAGQLIRLVDGGGAEPGTYLNLFSGLASDPGVDTWQIEGEGWSGGFLYDAGSIHLELATVPEPAMIGLMLAASAMVGCVGWRSRRRRSAQA